MNGHSDIDTNEATQHLKNILNLGKPESDAVERESVSNGDMESARNLTGDGSFIKKYNPIVREVPKEQFLYLPLAENDNNVFVFGEDVTIFGSSMHHYVGCNKIKIESIVDYGWEQKYYIGTLISMHISGMYLAYAIRAPQTPHGFVRIIKQGTNVRVLLKGPKGEVKDIAFSHSTNQILIGFVDQVGELYVHEVRDMGDKIVCNLLVHILRYPEPKPSDNHRIIWCPYIPDEVDIMDEMGDCPSSNDATSLLVITHDEIAEIYNVNILVKEYGTGDIPVDTIKVGMQVIAEHKKPISTAKFSPDGTALATASYDGDIKFFQVSLDLQQGCDSTPRCLHQWTPHEGKPLSMMFFLDNHKNHNPDVQFWKFAITGADNNREIKLWSCESWTCLQTIRFMPNKDDGREGCLKADLDLSSQYLFLSDINRKVMYILQILQEPSTSKAKICSLEEFSLSYPVLSLAIADVSKCKFKPLSPVNADNENKEPEPEIEDSETYENSEKLEGCLVKLFWIHTKSLQSCRIMYRPYIDAFQSVVSTSPLPQGSLVYMDRLSDIKMETQNRSENENDLSAEKVMSSSNPSTPLTSLSSHLLNCDDILLTPEDFTLTADPDVSSTTINNSYTLPVVEETSPRLSLHDKMVEPEEIATISVETNATPRRKSSQHSSTSSPSREVAEILDSTKLLNCDHETLRIIKVKKEPIGLDPLLNENLHKNDVLQEVNDTDQNHLEFPPNDWPQAPDPNKEYRIASRSDGDLNIQLSPREREHLTPAQRSTKRQESLREDEAPSPDGFNSEAKSLLTNINNTIERFSHHMNTIRDSFHSHKQDVREVQTELKQLQNAQKLLQNSLKILDDLDAKIATKVEVITATHTDIAHDRLDALFNQKELAAQQFLDRQITAQSQSIINSIGGKIDKSVKNEMKNTVVPQITKHMDSIKEQIQIDLHFKLNTVDNCLRDTVNKHIKSKQFNDVLSQSVSSQLQPQIQSACKEVFQNTIIPSMEKVCQSLFMQMNDCFQRGLGEFFQHFDTHRQLTFQSLDSTAKNTQDQLKDIVSTVQLQCVESVKKSQENQFDFKKCTEELVETVKQCIQEEVRHSLVEQPQNVAALRSQTATPIPQQDRKVIQQQLMHLVKQNQLNEAFQQALTAANIPIVLWLCESVSPDDVFGGSVCPLQQNVLLSLIHQLSGELQIKTELKVNYIEDAITSLDSNSPITKGNISKVVGNLQQRISVFLQTNPNHKLGRNLRRIHMALQAMNN